MRRRKLHAKAGTQNLKKISLTECAENSEFLGFLKLFVSECSVGSSEAPHTGQAGREEKKKKCLPQRRKVAEGKIKILSSFYTVFLHKILV